MTTSTYRERMMQHITEIVPELDTMPDWAEKAFKEGNFFNVALKKVKELERAALGVWRSKGCDCCQDDEAMEKFEGELAIAIGAKRYDDDSGWDLYSECDKRKVKRT